MAKRKTTTKSKSPPKKAKNVDLEPAIHEIGTTVWSRLRHRKPSLLERRWWDDRILEWAMTDEAVKVQMFRFVDVLPMLRDHEAINRHLHEYFEEVQSHLPWAARIGLHITEGNTVLGRALAFNARRNARRMAERFIAGHSLEEVSRAVRKIRDQGFAFTLDLLGEAVLTEDEADAYQAAYLEMISGLSDEFNSHVESPQIDRDDAGPIPRVNVSLKLTALDSCFSPIDPAGTAERVKERLRPLLRTAMEHHAFINIDMEQYSVKSTTHRIFREVLMESEFREFADVGIVIQAYLKDSEDDLNSLLKWAKKRKTPITVRLVKGAYWDYETVKAAYRGWPVPVFTEKWESDQRFEELSRLLIDHREFLRPAFGSHNLRSLAHVIAYAEHQAVPKDAYEIQMLYGMGQDQAQAFSELGHRVRMYMPFGELIPGMAYLVRRLLENTSNDSFLRHSLDDDVSIDQLMSPPAPETKLTTIEEDLEEVAMSETFQNEPLTDFTLEENQQAMQTAIEKVRDELGEEYPLMIDGKAYDTRNMLVSVCPFEKDTIVGRVSSGTADHATQAVDAARRSFREWAKMDTDYRAEYVELLAQQFRQRRLELAAWIIFETAKTWEEADADVAEAIDFCMYYAEQIRLIEKAHHVDVAGEENEYFYRPRGVCVVIAPWNFPLAILTGMTAAALATGNTVVMKPAEQSSIVAAKLMDCIQKIGLPDGVVNYVPGDGEEVGAELVGSPDVDVIAFTGSRDVGLEIYRRASDTDIRQSSVKNVIAEMGGKNAIIVDDDADLDEAVQGVVESAFGYSGQKCSACSRAIVLEGIYDQFVKRLQGAVEKLIIGSPAEPGTVMGPVIDETAVEKIQSFIEAGSDEAELLVSVDVSDREKQGFYVPPTVFVEVAPDAQIAQEEIFGPVLAVIRAKSMDEAFTFANSTPFALTGGVYSRSPENLQRARREFRVGNLYLNRPCTGALVHRQPFGGFCMSGIGTKAGGPDYLKQFLIPVNITENTMRRGFAPNADADEQTVQEESA